MVSEVLFIQFSSLKLAQALSLNIEISKSKLERGKYLVFYKLFFTIIEIDDLTAIDKFCLIADSYNNIAERFTPV